MQRCTAYGFTSARALWGVTLPPALCSSVLLVFLSRPATLPRAVLAVLLALSREPGFSAVTGFS